MVRMNPTELITWIRKWNPYCEHITLSVIFAKIHNDQPTHVISFGEPGTGKSRSSLELLQKLNTGTDIILDNTTTDRGLFETFMEYPMQDIVLDECSTLLRSLKTQDMIKLCMEQKSAVWTKNGSTETTPPYKGNIIINTNIEIADSVIDRCLTNKSVMNKEISLAFNKTLSEEIMHPTDYSPFLNHVKEVINDKTVVKLNQEEQKHVLDFCQQRIQEMEQEEGYSRRILLRELNYFTKAKKLFGTLNKEVLDFIEPYAETYIINAQPPSLLQNILGNGPIEKALLVKKMSEQGGYHPAHARKIINNAIETQKIKLTGKIITLNKTK